jgi:hypothetical protein
MDNGKVRELIANDILLRIAKRYANCKVYVYPECPELTPVEAVLRCAQQEGFTLTNALPEETPVRKQHEYTCPRCGGSGASWNDLDRTMKCPDCKGAGKLIGLRAAVPLVEAKPDPMDGSKDEEDRRPAARRAPRKGDEMMKIPPTLEQSKKENEREYALKLANWVLEQPNIDPDGNEAVLARQFLRAVEALNSISD